MGSSTATALAALKIGSRVAFERLGRPKAGRLGDVPCSPYAITTEWLTAVLCGKVPGAIVTYVEVKPASAGTHERHQLRVSYNEEGRRAALPTSIFTKSLPSVVTRMIGGFNGTARVEGNFYTQLRPELQIEAPLCYHSAYDRRTFAAIHLLEDMAATKSATFCSHKTYGSRVVRRSGRRRYAHLLCTKANHKGLFTPMCISEIGIRQARTKWGYATGNVFRAAIGHGISLTL